MTFAGPSPSGELARLFNALADYGVDFVVCGGIACIIHGVARVTADVDLCVRMDAANLQRLVDAARSLQLEPRAPEPLEALVDERKRQQWIDQKAARVFTLAAPDNPLQVDVLLQYPVPYDELSADAAHVQVGDSPVRISSKVHLIRAKRFVDPVRKTDLRDIEDLQELIDHERQAD